MDSLTSEQANQLSNNFLGIAQAVGDYRFDNWKNLSEEENKQIGAFQWSLLNYAEDILAFSATLVLDEVSESLNKIQTVTEEIQHTLRKLKNIQKVINIAGASITLGAAIISKDKKAIGEAITHIVECVKAKEEKEEKKEEEKK